MRLTVNCHKTDKNLAVNVNLEEWVIIIIKWLISEHIIIGEVELFK